jgi:type II secretory ATPase GspE/PulE/Tfp pilus assembly ATPase PilB-like protein
MTFASGLRSILRQDPDIILVGEIRDFETAEIAISAALTGHLVLSTLHTNDAAGAVSRLVSLGIPRFQVATSLLGVVAQRLIRTTCVKCKKPYTAQASDIELLGLQKEEIDGLSLYRGKGCEACRQTGYRGRQGLYEILTMTPELKSLIINEAPDNELKQQAQSDGMQSLKEQGILQVERGITTIDEIYRVVDMRV